MTDESLVYALFRDGGEAEAAVERYVSLIPDSRVVRVHRAPAETPSGPAGMALTVEFILGGRAYLALNGGPMYRFTEAISLQVSCVDQAEVDRVRAQPGRQAPRLAKPGKIPEGIRTPEQAAAVARHADAAVVGSAIVDRVKAGLGADGKATPGLVAGVDECLEGARRIVEFCQQR